MGENASKENWGKKPMIELLIGLIVGFLFGLFIQPIAKIAKWLANISRGEETEDD